MIVQEKTSIFTTYLADRNNKKILELSKEMKTLKQLKTFNMHENLKNSKGCMYSAHVLQKSLVAVSILLTVGSASARALPVENHTSTAMTQADRPTTIRGKIADANGEAIIGASITIKGAKGGVISDADGNFFLPGHDGDVLVISYIGMIPQEVTFKGRPLNIVLEEEINGLNEVVVIGYGTTKKKDLTGSIIQIKPDRLSNENPGTVQDVLRGTAGLSVGISNDAKGGGAMNIRGQRSVYTSGNHNSPLIILDGMQFYGELSEINPDDIEQIDILKDASSAAIYGAKAANGVIIISTKKGRNGAPVVKLTANFAAATLGIRQRYMSPSEYIQHKVDYFETSTYGINPATGKYEPYVNQMADKPGFYRGPNNLPEGISLDQWRSYDAGTAGMDDLAIWGSRINFQGNMIDNLVAGRSINWEDYTYRTGFQQDYNASVSGANDKANYYMSIGYLNNQGVKRHNSYDAFRASMRMSMDVNSWLMLSANANFQSRSDGTLNDPTGMLRNSPYADRYDEKGNLLQYTLTSPTLTMKGDATDFVMRYQSRERGYNVLNTIFNAKVKLPFNITYSFNISPRYQWYYNRAFTSQELPDSNPKDRGVDRNTSKRFDWSLNNTLTWDYTFAQKHHVVLTLVQEAEERKYWSDDLATRNIQPSDALGFHYTTSGDKDNTTWGSNDTHESADALLARMQYTYDDRYLLTASVRRDGYSAFGQNNPYATFPSVGLGWIFTNEKFWKWGAIMDYGKFRIAFGKNGNRSLADPYVALSDLTTGQYETYIINGAPTDVTYLRVNRLANPNLQWETSKSWNAGLDFSFMHSNITGSIEFYWIQTNNMIMAQRLPEFTGFNSITTNLGQVNNRGIELTINTRNIARPAFEWNTAFSFSYNKNMIKHLYGDYKENGVENDDKANGWFIGKAIDEIWDYKITGIWQVDQIEEAARYGQVPGDPIVYNNPSNDIKNSDGTLTPYFNDDDKVFLGRQTPPIRWSMRNDFTICKNFTVGFSIYSLIGWKGYSLDHWANDPLGDAFMNNENGGGYLDFGMQNFPWKDYWTLDNQTRSHARLNAQGPSSARKLHFYANRSFLRFDNISVAYTLPKRLVQKIKISDIKIFGNVKNIGVIKSSEWTYGDPENQDFSPRTYSMGINVTF